MDHGGGRGVTVPPLVCEQSGEQSGQPARHLGAQGGDVDRLLAEAGDQVAERGAAGVGEAAGEHLEEDDAGGVEVGALVDRLAERLLGGEVLERADGGLGGGDPGVVALEVEGEAEVGELDGAVVGEQDVAGLDVAVDDADAVQRGEAAEDLGGKRHGLLDRQRPFGHSVAQRAAGDRLERDEDGRTRALDVENADDVGVGEIAGDADLALQTRQRARGEAVLAQDLERDLAPGSRSWAR